MKRKLVKQGAATMMISLPSKWIKQNKLEKGNEVDLEESGNSIIIKPETFPKENKAIIDVSGYSPLVNRILMSLYIKGIDELEVKFSKKEEIKDFQKRVINELLGFEIIKQSQNSFLIKDITEEKQEVDNILQRILFILDSMAEELVLALEKKGNLFTIVEIDSSVNKFTNFCLRVLNKRGYRDFNKTPQIYGIVSTLEEIGDIYKKIASAKTKPNKEQTEIIKDLRVFLNMFKEILYDFKKEKAVEFAKKYEQIKKKISDKNIIDFYLHELNETIIKMNNYLLLIRI